MIEYIWKWTRLTSGPIVAAGIASLITFAATTLLLRTLPLHDAGLFAISMALVDTLSLVGALGQATLITRLYASAQAGSYDWLRDLIRLVAISIVPIALGVVISSRFYPLSPAGFALILVASLLSVPLSLSAYMLNANRYHTWGTLILRLPNSLLIVPAVLAATMGAFNNLNTVLIFFAIGVAATLALSLSLLARRLIRGSRRISLRQHFEGTIFLIGAGTHLMLNQGIVAVAGALLEPASLAAYAAIAVLLRPFKLVTNILAMVFSPRFIRQDRRSYVGPMIALAAGAAAAAFGYVLLGAPVAAALYGSRYQAAYPLIPWLATVGFLTLVRSMPMSHMAGRAPASYINRVILIEAGVVVASVLVATYAITRSGILGLAIGLALGYVARTSATFGLWHRFRRIDPAKGAPVNR
jgi:O-antigen/teichoic acid export membrane protein